MNRGNYDNLYLELFLLENNLKLFSYKIIKNGSYY